jgi:RNA polymerase sigma factor (TIGR02999 family)
MSDFADILEDASHRRERASADLLPLVYQELRALAAARLAQERPGQTLQPTALVHEAYLRLVAGEADPKWDGRRHFFAAAAEAMRRILVDRARQKLAVKHGGDLRRIELADDATADEDRAGELVALSEALDELERHEPQAAALVKLRYFAGLKHGEAAAALNLSRRAADRLWALARAWLYRKLNEA